MRREWAVLLLVPLALFTFGAGAIVIDRRIRSREVESTPGVHLFEEVMRLARDAYVVEPDVEKLVYGAAKGIVEHGLDEHCKVYDPAEWRQQRVRARGEYAGIGVRVGWLSGRVSFLWIDPDGPSGRAGLRPGDRLIRIDGLPVDHRLPLDEAAAPLRGPVGSPVELAVVGLHAVEERTVVVIRGMVEEQTAFGWMLDGPGGVAYVCVTGFRDNTLAQYRTLVSQLREEGMRSMILDLRGNRGGRLDAAVDLADRFVPAGPLLRTVGRIEEPEVRNATPLVPEGDLPLVVLVDGQTASASEVLSGALQDHGRAILVGERTWGKGVVQRVMPFSESGWDGGIKITVAHYLTPSGRCIEKSVALPGLREQAGGLRPDVLLPVEPRQREVHDRLRDRNRLVRSVREAIEADDQFLAEARDVHVDAAQSLLRGSFSTARRLSGT